MTPDAWTRTRDRYRRPEPSRWSRFTAWGDGFFARNTIAQIAASFGCVAAAVIALFTAIGGG